VGGLRELRTLELALPVVLCGHGRAPESVLHQLRLDVGASFGQGAPLSWQQKQRLLEAIRPLAHTSTANRPNEESFRLVQLTAGAAPLRLNTQQHVSPDALSRMCTRILIASELLC